MVSENDLDVTCQMGQSVNTCLSGKNTIHSLWNGRNDCTTLRPQSVEVCISGDKTCWHFRIPCPGVCRWTKIEIWKHHSSSGATSTTLGRSDERGSSALPTTGVLVTSWPWRLLVTSRPWPWRLRGSPGRASG